MKKYFIALVVALMAFAVSASAQVKFGVTAGMNFNSAKVADVKMDAKAGWNVGATLQFNLPLGFSLQPSVVYMHKAAGFETPSLSSDFLENLKAEMVQTVGSVVVPVSVQWGPDLLVFRPFLDVTPYIGYALSNEVTTSLADFKFSSWQGKERFEYGLGIGAGINVWKLQVIARYNWNFGSLYNVEGWDDIKSELKGLSAENENFGGVTLSLAFLF